MSYNDNGETRYFHDANPEFVGNIYTGKDKGEIRNLSRKKGVTFVSFKVLTNYQSGEEDTKGTIGFTVKAFGDWAEFILDNPDLFAPGKRVRVRGQLEEEEYRYDRTVTTVDGDEVEFEETRRNLVVTIDDSMSKNGFISPSFQFSRKKGGGSTHDEDEGEAPARSRRSRRGNDEVEDEARSRRRSRRENDEDEAPSRSRRSRRGNDEDEDEAPSRSRRRSRPVRRL